MKKDRRGIMSACEYSISSLQNIKKGFLDVKNPKHELVWAIGGIIVTLTSNLLMISHDVIENAPTKDTPNALDDIREIQKQFNDMVEKMVGGND